MNGYELHSDSYKKYLEMHPDMDENSKVDMQRKIKALDFLADSTKEERLELFNSSAFNDVVKGYFLMAVDNMKLEEKVRNGLLQELRWLFDTVSAEQAEKYYNTH